MTHAIPESIAVEARAKILWGEDPEKVRAFLMEKHVGEKDAAVLLGELMGERTAAIRGEGWKKIWTGGAMISAPIAYYFITHVFIGYWNVKGFAWLVVLAAVGIVRITNGLSMALRPGSIRGDF